MPASIVFAFRPPSRRHDNGLATTRATVVAASEAVRFERRTIVELADELEVNAKTIRRDIVVLRDAEFPLEESTGPSGRKSYRVTNGSRLPDYPRLVSVQVF